MMNKQHTRQATNVDVEIGFRIRKARQLKQLSQTQVAMLLGITYQQLQKYELGKNKISASRLTQIAKILNIPEQALLNPCLSDIRNKHVTDTQNISNLWLKISDKNHQNLVLKMMETFAEFGS